MLKEWEDKPQTEKYSKKTSDKGLKSTIYKEYLKVNNKETEIWLKNRPKILTDTSSKMIYRWQISTWKDVPHYIS